MSRDWYGTHCEAMRRFDDIWSVEQEVREQALADRVFATKRGGMWAGQYAPRSDDGDDAGAARFEVPKVAKALNRIFSEYRANRVTVDFRAKDAEALERDADNLDGLYRADEQDSEGGGQEAYDTAYDEGIAGGMGAWRLRTRYEDEEDEDNEKQRIDIVPIHEADQCVFFDRTAKSYAKRDARFAFVLFTMSRDVFEEEHGDKSAVDFANPTSSETGFDWVRPDDLTLAEYYVVEDQSVTRVTFERTLPGEDTERRVYDEAELEGADGVTLRDSLKAGLWQRKGKRRIKRQRVRKYLLSGAEVLADEGYVAGRFIPIVPYYAKRWMIDGVEWFKGHTRDSIDVSRLYNLAASNLADASSGPVDATPILLAEQVLGYEAAWAKRKDHPAFLTLNPVLDSDGNPLATQPIGFLQPAQVQPNMAALLQLTGQDIAELTGEADQVETVPANTSDDAIKLVHDRADMRTFLYRDNFRKSLEWCGEVYASMAAEVYSEEGRTLTAIDAEGEKKSVTLREEVRTDKGSYVRNDFANGRYDVVVDVGPSTKTRRDKTRGAMEKIAETAGQINDMETAQAALIVAALNTEGEGLDGFRDMMRRKGLALGCVEPTPEEAREIEAARAAAGQQQDPAMIAAQAQLELAQAEKTSAMAKVAEAETRRMTAEAQAEVAKAKIVEMLSKVQREDRAALLAEVDQAIGIERDDVREEIEIERAANDMERHEAGMMGGDDGNAD